MLSKVAASVIAAASLAAVIPAAQAQVPTELITNGPQANPGDSSTRWSAQQNVRESAQYDRLVRTNSAFRRAREQKECGSINDAQLHQSCLASFRSEGALSGSSETPQMQPGYGASAPAPSQPSYPTPQPGYTTSQAQPQSGYAPQPQSGYAPQPQPGYAPQAQPYGAPPAPYGQPQPR